MPVKFNGGAAGREIVSGKVLLAVARVASVNVTTTVEVPGAVGVPKMAAPEFPVPPGTPANESPAGIGGGHIHPAPWLLIVYPLVRYALYSGLAMLLATVMHPIVSFAIMLVVMVLELIVAPGSGAAYLPAWLKAGLYAVLPSPNVLSETRFLTITEAALKQTSPLHHLTALAYGLDWAVVFFLLAAWLFSRRSLSRE